MWFASGSTLVMQLGYTAVMSRTLDPKAFGLVAGAMIGLRFVSLLARFGVGNAVVQRPLLDEADIRAAMTISVLIGSVSTLGVVLVSPGMATLLGQTESGLVMRWLSLALLAGSLGAVPEALLRRRMKYRAHALLSTLTFAVSYPIIGVGGALAGWGVWSLVAAAISQPALMTLGCIILTRPPLSPSLDIARSRQILRFGGTVSVTSLLEALGSTLDTLAVSRWLGPASLGQYTRATYLVQLPTEQVSTAAIKVLLPSLSSVQTETERFRRGTLASVGILSFLVVVPVAVIAASAPAIAPLVLGGGWDVAGSVLPLVSAALGVALLTTIYGVAAEAAGLVAVKLRVQATSLAFTACAIGLVGVAGPTVHRLGLAWLCAEIVRHCLYLTILRPRLGISAISIGKRYGASAVFAVAAAMPFVVTLRLGGHTGPIWLLLSSALAVVALLAVWRLRITSTVRGDIAKSGFIELLRSSAFISTRFSRDGDD